MKSGGKMLGISWDLNTVFMGLAMVVFIYTLYENAKKDKTAGERSLEVIADVKGIANSTSAELDELGLKVQQLEDAQKKFIDLYDQDSRTWRSFTTTKEADIEALKTRVDAIGSRPPSLAKVAPIKVEPVKVEVEVRYARPKAKPEKRRSK